MTGLSLCPMTAEDVETVLPLYLAHYNGKENAEWTNETAGRRIRQVITMQDSRSYLLKKDGALLGFVMGFLKQYDDLLGYTLEEILVASDKQNKGYGTKAMELLEETLKNEGVSMVELLAVNDEMHEHFYGKFGFRNTKTLVPKAKFFE